MKTSAEGLLRSRDARLGSIVDGEPFKAYRNNDLYRDLLESIMSQQLSVKASATIFGRFLALYQDGDPAPVRVLATVDADLRAAGVSRQKIGYVKNVADFALRHDISHRALRSLSDDEIIALLTQIKGVGQWTVEMLLMFPLNRPDVFPADDLGIQLAMKKLYGLRGDGPRLRRRMAAIAEAWRPHRTLACKYLWRWRGTW
jgi:DNA-3-methyladenine glycosylase II